MRTAVISSPDGPTIILVYSVTGIICLVVGLVVIAGSVAAFVMRRKARRRRLDDVGEK